MNLPPTPSEGGGVAVPWFGEGNGVGKPLPLWRGWGRYQNDKLNPVRKVFARG